LCQSGKRVTFGDQLVLEEGEDGHSPNQWRIQKFYRVEGGVQQIQLRTEGRDNGDLGAVAS
jgi:hypothetical protein